MLRVPRERAKSNEPDSVNDTAIPCIRVVVVTATRAL
jgi:hypothetical protein